MRKPKCMPGESFMLLRLLHGSCVMWEQLQALWLPCDPPSDEETDSALQWLVTQGFVKETVTRKGGIEGDTWVYYSVTDAGYDAVRETLAYYAKQRSEPLYPDEVFEPLRYL